MPVYITGKPFPHPSPNIGHDCLNLTPIENGSFDLCGYLSGIQSNEIRAWKKGRLRIGLFEKNNIPFFLVQFPEIGLEFDAPVNVYMIGAEARAGFPNTEANLIQMFLIDRTKNILRAQRSVSIESSILEELAAICHRQENRYQTYAEAQVAISAIQRTCSLKNMIHGTDMRKPGHHRPRI